MKRRRADQHHSASTLVVWAALSISIGCARQTAHDRSARDAQAAAAAYVLRQYADCARLYTAASRTAIGRAKADYLYSSGVCDLRQGKRSSGIESLRQAVEAHPSYYDDVVHNSAVREHLADDPAWTALIARWKPAYDAYLSSVNAELRQMFADDQEDRKGGPDKVDWSVVEGRDAARRERVEQLVTSGQIQSADDYYFAAMIFQHGEDEASYDRAFRYAVRAAELDPSFVKARWLAAAARDRYHMSRGEPQLYGTQYKRIEGRWWLWPVDFHVTDDERAEWGVEPLATARQRLEKMNAKPK
jgi:tetratricopeptide (TPR) repeat protein